MNISFTKFGESYGGDSITDRLMDGIYFLTPKYPQSKKDSKDEESIQSSSTPVPGYQMEQ